MTTVPIYLVMFRLWLLFAVIALVPSAPIVFLSRRRVHWHSWELLAFVIPFIVWMLLLFSELESKSLSNLGEPVYISLAVVLAALIRAIVGARVSERAFANSLLGGLCAVAALIYFFVPCLPE